VSSILQLEEAVIVQDAAPKLAVEWSSPWHDFVTSIRPALARSERPLAGEAPFGLVPLRIMIPSYLLEAFLIFAVIVVQVKIAALRPYVVPRFSSHDVIYYSGDELPRTQDVGGAEAGTVGTAGGEEAHHRTQTIKIARGGSLSPQVVDAPNLKLPSSRDAVANLLAIRPNPGPPPAEGLRSNRAAPNLSTAVVAPAPNVVRDYTRNGVQLDSVIAPAPSVTRDRTTTAPNFSATLIPPAPSVTSSHRLVAPALGPSVIPPAPSAAREHGLNAPMLSTSVVAPAPTADRERSRSNSALTGSVIPPAPGGVSRELSSSPVQMTNAAVVPPPVSAPERNTGRNSNLNLPASSVVAPPPSADISQDTHRLASGNTPDPTRAVVPPPPTQSASGSFMSSLMGKLFGASEVVPPPPAVHSNGPTGGSGTSLARNIVPPPPIVAASPAGGSPHGARNGMGSSIGSNVVAPPPSAGISGGTGTRSGAASSSPTVGVPNVVPPPPTLAGNGGGSGNTGGGAGAAGGTLLANNIVPPPPSLGGGSAATGGGSGPRGAGLGAPLDAGAILAPPASGSSGTNAGAVISTQPGTKVGLPSSGGTGSLAMSPSGGDKPGLGGAGGGTSIGHGEGSGSGMKGAGSGAGKSGAGVGSDASARGGIAPAPGPGGSGNAPSGNPAVRGIDISGGSSQVTIPAFGSDPSASDPQSPRHSSLKQRQSFDVDVVATASSGGAFEPYKNLLHGEKHTIYPDTSSSLGTAVMEYSEESVKGRGVLTPPQPIRTTLPEGLPRGRMVVICTLDASGNLKNLRVLDPGPAEMTAKVLAALNGWKFRAALRGDQPVEVTAILGFGIDTNDRF